MQYILLGGKRSNGSMAIVCDCHFNKVSKLSWYLDTNGYAMHKDDSLVVRMHTLIASPPTGFVVDHIDGERLNNICTNLRAATALQNSHNGKLKKNNSSGFKGVYRVKGTHYKPWRAQIGVNCKLKYLGTFHTAQEAAVAYIGRTSENPQPIHSRTLHITSTCTVLRPSLCVSVAVRNSQRAIGCKPSAQRNACHNVRSMGMREVRAWLFMHALSHLVWVMRQWCKVIAVNVLYALQRIQPSLSMLITHTSTNSAAPAIAT